MYENRNDHWSCIRIQIMQDKLSFFASLRSWMGSFVRDHYFKSVLSACALLSFSSNLLSFWESWFCIPWRNRFHILILLLTAFLGRKRFLAISMLPDDMKILSACRLWILQWVLNVKAASRNIYSWETMVIWNTLLNYSTLRSQHVFVPYSSSNMHFWTPCFLKDFSTACPSVS